MKNEHICHVMAAAYIKMSPKLLEWFTKYSTKYNENKKLQYIYISKSEDGVFFTIKNN